MRTIKFRGKCVDDGSWVYGSLIRGEKSSSVLGIDSISWDNDTGAYWADVKPETVGQFTGLLDKNGNEIYEGDILQVTPSMNATVVFRDGEFVVDYHSKTTEWNNRIVVWKDDITVIGNIHEASK